MLTYHKINSLFKRGKQGAFIQDKWSEPVFEYLAETPWEAQEKVDGTNMRIGLRHPDNDLIPNVYKEVFDDVVMYIGGRSDRAQIPGDLLENMKPIAHRVKDFVMANFGVDPDNPVTYYGEGFGAGIQKTGKEYSDTKTFCLFDSRIGETTWLNQATVAGIAKELDILYPPIIETADLLELVDLLREGKTIPISAFGRTPIEGYVLRPQVELLTGRGRVISKLKYVDKWW